MKKWRFLFIGFVFILKIGVSQNLINMSKEEVYKYLNKKGIKGKDIETGKREEDGALWVAYADETARNIYFFDSNSICNYYRRLYPIIFFDPTLKFVKKNYRQLADSLWQDSSSTGSFVLTIMKKEKVFMLDESPAKPK